MLGRLEHREESLARDMTCLGSINRVWSALRGEACQLRWSSTAWQVSSCGRVRSSRGVISYGHGQPGGYRRVRISNQNYFVHRLVAATFLGPPADPSRWQVNHLDGDPGNNCVSNLQYVTPSENIRHAWDSLGRKSAAEKTGKALLWRQCGETKWSRCSSQREAGRLLGVWQSDISKCCRNLTTRAMGNRIWYEFKNMDPDEKAAQMFCISGETWSVAKYPGEFSPIQNLMVSNYGRVSPAPTGKGCVSKGTLASDGYFVVQRQRRKLLVHRLVAGTFLGHPQSPDMQVNHKDSDRGNNHVLNLEYVTASQNVQHAALQRGSRTLRGKAIQAQVKGYGGQWMEFDSMRMAAAHTGVSSRSINRACNSCVDVSSKWKFRFVREELLLDERWRPVLLDGVRAHKA